MKPALPKHCHIYSCFILLATLVYFPLSQVIAKRLNPNPELILMLGGGQTREPFTIQFAKQHPHLDIWASSSSLPKRSLFQNAGIPANRIYFDDRATDTVTNFTSLLPTLKQRQIRHVYLLTSDFHMPRATAIATLVLSSHGIAFTTVPIPDPALSESYLRIPRDIGRALLWLTTGYTGASLNPNVRLLAR